MAQALRTPGYRGRRRATGQHLIRSDLFPHPRHFRGRHHAATIFVVLLLAVVGFRLFPGKDVTVLNDGQSFRVSATFDARGEALAAAAVDLGPGDRVLYGSGGRHTSLAVQRARPIAVAVDGSVVTVRTHATTIAGALAAAGVDLLPGDRVFLDGRLATSRGPLFGASYALRGGVSLPAAPAVAPDMVTVTVVRARPVTVFVDTLRVDTSSAAETVEDLLAELGMTVRNTDLVQPGLQSPLSAGLTVRLKGAKTISVKLDGKDQSLYTQAFTVADVLRELGVTLGPEDTVTPALSAYVTTGMSVVISLTRQVPEEEQEQVLPATVYENDASAASGTVRVIEGTPGVRLHKYLTTYRNGERVDRVAIAPPAVVQAPVATRQITGTKQATQSRPTLNAPGVNPGTTYKKQLKVTATWYNAEGGAWAPGDPNYGRTATGAMLDYGVCAVDPSVIPLYTRFYVPGYGNCVALDTGSGVRGPHIDLGFPGSTRSGWGVQEVVITVLD